MHLESHTKGFRYNRDYSSKNAKNTICVALFIFLGKLKKKLCCVTVYKGNVGLPKIEKCISFN